MRTKTLLLTAAISAAGILATMAAGVTSVNVVGYINVSVPAGFSFISNQLTGPDLSVGTLLGKLDKSVAPPGTVLYALNAGSFDANTFAPYYDPTDATTLDWDTVGPQTLPLGAGFIIYNPGAAFNVTFVGEVAQGSLSTPIAKGFNLVASQVPQTGPIQSALGYSPAPGDVVYVAENGSLFSAHTYAAYYDPTDSTTLNWDDGGGEPVVKVGSACLLYATAGGSWTRNFTVN